MASSHSQEEPPKSLIQLLGGPPPGAGSRQMYQSRLALLREARLSLNHGCSAELWFGTKSMMTFRPLACAAASRRSKSAMAPKRGSMPQ